MTFILQVPVDARPEEIAGLNAYIALTTTGEAESVQGCAAAVELFFKMQLVEMEGHVSRLETEGDPQALAYAKTMKERTAEALHASSNVARFMAALEPCGALKWEAVQ